MFKKGEFIILMQHRHAQLNAVEALLRQEKHEQQNKNSDELLLCIS